MKRGIFVTGTFFFANADTVWRSRLHQILTEAIWSLEALAALPIYVSLPYEPWIQSEHPRPPARLTISVMQNEWRPHTAEGEHALILRVSEVVLEWLKSSTTEFNTMNVPNKLVIELTFEHMTFHRHAISS